MDPKLDFKSHIQYLEIKIAKSPMYLSKLHRLQNKAIRIIANCNRFQSVTLYFHELELLKIGYSNLKLAK